MAIAKDDFDAFMDQCRINLVGASDAGIKTELYDVLDEFCEHELSETQRIAIGTVLLVVFGGLEDELARMIETAETIQRLRPDAPPLTDEMLHDWLGEQ